MTAFESFWARYPRKVGKLDAERAFALALKRASEEEIMAGLEQYRVSETVRNGFICHPATFLRQGRWMDEPDTAVSVGGLSLECAHEPRCASRWSCGKRQQQERAS